MRRFHTLLAALPLVVAACGGSTDTTASDEDGFHAVSPDAVGFEGTSTCGSFTDTDSLECEFDMSDPRVSGTETTDRYRDLFTSDPVAGWVADGLLTNDEGTWRGTVMAADGGSGLFGEAHYVGEGAYDGLEARWYFRTTGTWQKADVMGWIQDTT